MLESFLAIMGLLAIVSLIFEYGDFIITVICIALAIAATFYAIKNFDATALMWLSSVVALVCLLIWNKRREQTNKRKRAAEAIRQANAAVETRANGSLRR